MPDKTKKELKKILINMAKEIEELEEAVEYWKKKDVASAKLIDIKNIKLNGAIKNLADFKEKAKNEFIGRGRVIGNLVGMIRGMVRQAADVDGLTTTIQMPKFLDE